MIELRNIIKGQLKSVHPRVTYQGSHEKLAFPYLVYDIVNINDDGEGFQQVTLDVDGWDNSADTTELETLMKKVNQTLNKKTFVSGDSTVTFYIENKLPLTDDEVTIKRRKYTYQGRLFERG